MLNRIKIKPFDSIRSFNAALVKNLHFTLKKKKDKIVLMMTLVTETQAQLICFFKFYITPIHYKTFSNFYILFSILN